MFLLNITSCTTMISQVFYINLPLLGRRFLKTCTKHPAMNHPMTHLFFDTTHLRNLRMILPTAHSSPTSQSQREWHYPLLHRLCQREHRSVRSIALFHQRHLQRETRFLFPSLGEREMNIRLLHRQRQINIDQQHLGLEQAVERSSQLDIEYQPS